MILAIIYGFHIKWACPHEQKKKQMVFFFWKNGSAVIQKISELRIRMDFIFATRNFLEKKIKKKK